MKSFIRLLGNKRYILIAILSLSISLAALATDVIHEFDAILVSIVLVCTIVAISALIGLQIHLHNDIYRSKIDIKEAIKADGIRVAIVAICMLGISVISGFTAVGLQFTIFPMIGYSASLITIKVMAVIIAIALIPIVGITFFAPLRNVGRSLAEDDSKSSHKAIRKSLALARIEAADIKDYISAYRPL